MATVIPTISIEVDSSPTPSPPDSPSTSSREIKTSYLATTGRPRKASVGRPRRNSATQRLTKKIPTKLTVAQPLYPNDSRQVNQLTSHFSHIAEIGKDPYP
jgi:hypothetical protein